MCWLAGYSLRATYGVAVVLCSVSVFSRCFFVVELLLCCLREALRARRDTFPAEEESYHKQIPDADETKLHERDHPTSSRLSRHELMLLSPRP